MKTLLKVLFLIFPCIVQVQAQKIGLLLDDYIIERWYSDQRYFTEKVKELGGEVLVEVAYSDTAQQVELAKKLIGSGAKVLVVIPTDSHQAARIADLAKKIWRSGSFLRPFDFERKYRSLCIIRQS